MTYFCLAVDVLLTNRMLGIQISSVRSDWSPYTRGEEHTSKAVVTWSSISKQIKIKPDIFVFVLSLFCSQHWHYISGVRESDKDKYIRLVSSVCKVEHNKWILEQLQLCFRLKRDLFLLWNLSRLAFYFARNIELITLSHLLHVSLWQLTKVSCKRFVWSVCKKKYNIQFWNTILFWGEKYSQTRFFCALLAILWFHQTARRLRMYMYECDSTKVSSFRSVSSLCKVKWMTQARQKCILRDQLLFKFKHDD